jgi:ATP-dependent helicase/nuclease subunit A
MTAARRPTRLTRSQRSASAPNASVWVSASAGTGKTKVLTDRVLRLLLNGTPPERILCLTFTRAAAAEMALRISTGLAAWTIADDAALAEDLAALTDVEPDAETCDLARRLFAAVLDVPGGMKIQTIHAFCQSLLRRFPLEAGVAPHFQVADERMSLELLGAARARVMTAAQRGPGDPLTDALAHMTAIVGEVEFGGLLDAVSEHRPRFDALIARYGGTDGFTRAMRARLDVAEGATATGFLAAASADEAFDADGLAHAVQVLSDGTKTDRDRATQVDTWLKSDQATRAARFGAYRGAYFTQAGKPTANLVTKKLAAANPQIAAILSREQRRLEELSEQWNAVRVAESSAALIEVAAHHLAFYRREKERQAALDYDDQIDISRRLLTSPGLAPWVLYKLDGGLDHLLIDEAQDTSPDQWSVIASLADEFFVGEGSRDVLRTMFVVGDEKQSIFSFQGADPRALVGMHRHFERRVKAAEQLWQPVPLEVSFRSTSAVLTVVDTVFAQDDARAGVTFEPAPIRHLVERTGAGGRVELWTPVEPRESTERAAWTPPVAREPADDPAGALATLIADRIKDWTDGPATIERGAWLESRDRRVQPGDVMVLVRRRTGFVDHLLRALKARDVAVAGVDRMVLTDQLAVMDLIALGAFCLLPSDDLTLATVLKSPLVGLDEDALFTLAHGRDKERLWTALRRRRDENPLFEEAYNALAVLLAAADTMPPFEFYTEVLTVHGGRRGLLARLGPESADAIDEFLALALTYGRSHAPSLQGFLHWIEDGRAEIIRDLEQGRNEVRIMTVHGAKGLQAPIVFLPDTMRKPQETPRLLWLEDESPAAEPGAATGLLWPGRTRREDAVSRAARARVRAAQDDEYRRLLYVAMTRAEDRLYVCGWRGKQKAPPDCWYELIRRGIESLEDTEPFETPDGHSGLCYAVPQTAEPAPRPPTRPVQDALVLVPPELKRPPAPEPALPRPLAPSRAGDAPPVRSPIDLDGRSTLERGVFVHRMLELLPALEPAARPDAAHRVLAGSGLPDTVRDSLIADTLSLLTMPALAPLFGPDALAEAPIAAVVGNRAIAGQIDRLLARDEEVIAVDYKTGRVPPESAESVPKAYIDQMAGYRAALAAVFPDRKITCGLLFTDGPALIWLPDELLTTSAP